ncbi:helix-turn-helix domain-containing protein [Companilactobacillus insicii]|uniref:helix-turn-helix domain-containing protein n=1 Tax=Companilactobacillus insicii TaxID=1732567 RepID=UPI0013DE21C8|nr:helix-turn-helix transcriptional regulator [Companilactobacillus insicii]
MFSENLKKLRTDKGLSQEQLSEIIDVSRQSISKYESGVTEPSFDKLIAIAKYFDVSIDFLLLSKSNNNSAPIKSDRIAISSHFESLEAFDSVASYYAFTISKIIGSNSNGPQAVVWGIYDSGLFGDKKKMLAYYRSYEDAKKEIFSINAAMQQGQTNYDLQYFVNVKTKGLNYIIDDSIK